MAIYRGTGGSTSTTEQATIDAVNEDAATATTKAAEASASATAAATSASSASSSATSASSSASTATTKASEASTSATNAASSASAASTSASAASTSASNAASSATTATTQASSATTSAANASASETAAETAESNASDYSSDAQKSAYGAEDVLQTLSDSSTLYSARHYAAKASADSATATTKASEASSSASAAASSASAAQAAEDAALAALDNFDDRYLGVKTSDPTVDNDGDALVAGALYYNSTDDVMKVYEGSIWVAAYASLSGTLVAANNLSDLASASAARTNLGLVIGTDVLSPTGDGSNLTGIDALPLQTGHSGKYLTTNGTSASWGTVDLSSKQDILSEGSFVDGDKTKLDGIESGADVTDTANVTAAGALMDSEVTNLAQVKAFDSSDYATAAQGTTADSAMQDLVDDTTPQLGGNLDANGFNITIDQGDLLNVGGLHFETFNTYNIGVISTDGSTANDLYICPDVNENVYIRHGTNAIFSRESMADFIANGAVNLYHNNSKKIETTSSGVTVTGTCAATSFTGDGSSLTGIATDLVDDTTPQLGGDLDTNGNAIDFGASGWSIALSGTDLVFSYGGVAKIKFASDGEIVTVDDVTAFGTV
jgi:hypothetical protein